MTIKRLMTKGPPRGICNICGVDSKLTSDHIPPKGCIRISRVEMLGIADFMHAEKPPGKGRYSQDGVKYRTICQDCNSRLLGTKYDPEFINLINHVGSYIKAARDSNLILPKTISVIIKPQKIMRAIVGHLLAFELNRYVEGGRQGSLSEYFLDDKLNLPDGINIYCWVYPYNDQLLIRDAALKNFKLDGFITFWLMKFYPLAFFVVFEQEGKKIKFKFPDLAKYGKLSIDQDSQIYIDLDVIPPQRWPEAPSENTITIYGQGAMGALKN